MAPKEPPKKTKEETFADYLLVLADFALELGPAAQARVAVLTGLTEARAQNMLDGRKLLAQNRVLGSKLTGGLGDAYGRPFWGFRYEHMFRSFHVRTGQHSDELIIEFTPQGASRKVIVIRPAELKAAMESRPVMLNGVQFNPVQALIERRILDALDEPED